MHRTRFSRGRHTALAAIFANLTAVLAVLIPASVAAVDFEDIARRAAALAAQPFKAPTRELPRSLRDLTYDQYRDIRFKPARSMWRTANLPFEVQMLHVGTHYDQPVRIFEVVAGVPREVRFDPDLFDYGANKLDPAQLRGAGFSGFRVHFSLNTPKYKDEVLVFQGASYFRALGRISVTGSRRAVSRSTPPLRRESSFRASSSFGSRGPRRPRVSSRSMRFSIRRAWPALTASCCVPVPKPS